MIIFLIILLICFIFAIILLKFIDKKEVIKSKKIDKIKPIEISNLKINSKEFDLLSRLKFMGEFFYEETSKNNNIFHIRFSKDFPRYFTTYNIKSLEIIFNLLRFCTDDFKKVLIILNFEAIKVNELNVNFNIKVAIKHIFLEHTKSEAIKNFLETDTNFNNSSLLRAKLLASKLRIPIVYKNENREVSFMINVNFNNVFSTKEIYQNIKLNKKEILIAHLNPIIFNDLRGELINSNIIPCMDLENAKRHLKNPMFLVDIAFIDADIIGNSRENILFLSEISKEKDIRFVIILNNKNDEFLIKQILSNAIFLKMPYTYEDIYAIFNLDNDLSNKELSYF